MADTNREDNEEKRATDQGGDSKGAKVLASKPAADSPCNGRKGDILLRQAPVTVLTLQSIAVRAKKAREVHDKVVADKGRDRVLGKLGVALDKGTVTKADLELLLKDITLAPPITGGRPPAFLTPGWFIVEEKGNLIVVEKDGKVGADLARRGRKPTTRGLAPSAGSKVRGAA